MRKRVSFSRVAAASIVILPIVSGHSQNAGQQECNGAECATAVFDLGVVFRPPVGSHGITELMVAVEQNDAEKVTALLAGGEDPNARNDSGATALLMASAHGSLEIVDQLLAADADPDIASNGGDTPLAIAIQYQQAAIAMALLKGGANPDVYHSADNPRLRKHALVRAAVLGQADVVHQMIASGVNLADSGLEALNGALWQRHEDVAREMIGSGVDLNAPTYDAEQYPHMQTGERVLQTAAQQGLLSATRLLLEHGADVNDKNSRGQSALYFAARQNHQEVAALLLGAGANVTGGDVQAALESGNEELALRLIAAADLASLPVKELDKLIAQADAIDSPAVLDRLYAAKDVVGDNVPVTTLLFARADTENCELVKWNIGNRELESLYSSPGACEQDFHFNRPRAELYLVDETEISVVSLDSPRPLVQSIEFPVATVEASMAALRERVAEAYNGIDASYMTARVVQVGVLGSGDLAFAVHADGPADETYGYLFALSGGNWRLVRNADCHRFDPCRFGDIAGHSLRERPARMTSWHPDIRRNPYFADKTQTTSVSYDYLNREGVVNLDIDGQKATLHYAKSESGHCVDDCVYTSSLKLELAGDEILEIGPAQGNNAIVDRYALVWRQPRAQSELIDLATGESVFGRLQIAGWLF